MILVQHKNRWAKLSAVLFAVIQLSPVVLSTNQTEVTGSQPSNPAMKLSTLFGKLKKLEELLKYLEVLKESRRQTTVSSSTSKPILSVGKREPMIDDGNLVHPKTLTEKDREMLRDLKYAVEEMKNHLQHENKNTGSILGTFLERPASSSEEGSQEHHWLGDRISHLYQHPHHVSHVDNEIPARGDLQLQGDEKLSGKFLEKNLDSHKHEANEVRKDALHKVEEKLETDVEDALLNGFTLEEIIEDLERFSQKETSKEKMAEKELKTLRQLWGRP